MVEPKKAVRKKAASPVESPVSASVEFIPAPSDIPAPGLPTISVGKLLVGAIFEYNGERFTVCIPVQPLKVVGQRLTWREGAWIRGSAASFDPDTQVILK
jgi:hypothetical protein